MCFLCEYAIFFVPLHDFGKLYYEERTTYFYNVHIMFGISGVCWRECGYDAFAAWWLRW